MANDMFTTRENRIATRRDDTEVRELRSTIKLMETEVEKLDARLTILERGNGVVSLLNECEELRRKIEKLEAERREIGTTGWREVDRSTNWFIIRERNTGEDYEIKISRYSGKCSVQNVALNRSYCFEVPPMDDIVMSCMAICHFETHIEEICRFVNLFFERTL